MIAKMINDNGNNIDKILLILLCVVFPLGCARSQTHSFFNYDYNDCEYNRESHFNLNFNFNYFKINLSMRSLLLTATLLLPLSH